MPGRTRDRVKYKAGSVVGEESFAQDIATIGVPDLLEHKDQLLAAIHAVKGYEKVNIDDVIRSRVNMPLKQYLPILMNSDAQKATFAKQDAAHQRDKQIRGIKEGEGYSMGYDFNLGGLVPRFNLGGLVQYFNKGGKVDNSARIKEIKAGSYKHADGSLDRAAKQLQQLGMNSRRIEWWKRKQRSNDPTDWMYGSVKRYVRNKEGSWQLASPIKDKKSVAEVSSKTSSKIQVPGPPTPIQTDKDSELMEAVLASTSLAGANPSQPSSSSGGSEVPEICLPGLVGSHAAIIGIDI